MRTILYYSTFFGDYTYQASAVSEIYAAIKTPTIHYHNGSTWHSSNPDSWTRANYPTQSTSKSIFDPCPYGYRVPTSNFNTNTDSDFLGFPKPPTWNPSTNMINGQTWLGSWWPTSGLRNNGSAALYNIGSYGYYWSASQNPSYSHDACNLAFYSGSVTLVGYNYYCTHSFGFSLRCVQEERKKFL